MDEKVTAPTEAPAPPTDVFAQRTGISLSEAANQPLGAAAEPTKQAEPVEPAKQAEPAKTAEAPAPTTDWSYKAILDSYGKDLKPDDPRLGQFAFHKELHSKTVQANEAQALRIMELETALKAQPQPKETLDPSAYQLEIAALKEQQATELKEYHEWKAKQDLTGNEAFRREYDGKRVELLEEARATAAEVGLEQEKVDALFEAKTELQIRKAVKALELDDEAAEALLLEKALSSSSLEKKKEALLSGKSGKTLAEAAAEYKAAQADFGVRSSQNLTKAFQGLLLNSVERVPDTLAKESPFFATDQGKLVFEELSTRFRKGYDLESDEVVRNFALARVAPIFERHATAMAAKVTTLEAQIATLTKNVPGNLGQGSAPSSGRPTNASPGFHDPFAQRTGIDLPAPRR